MRRRAPACISRPMTRLFLGLSIRNAGGRHPRHLLAIDKRIASFLFAGAVWGCFRGRYELASA